MNDEDRRLMVEGIAEMRELKGELRAFKEHVIGRIERLEQGEGQRGRDRLTVVGLFVSSGVLAVNILVHFFK
jgi:hypothetical protein